MGYKTAKDVLPEELLQIVQEYVEGEYVYIPRKEGCQRSWGETTASREITRRRNAEIRRRHQGGASVRQLAEVYYLSPKTVYKIVAARGGE
jgi:Response regulator containing a CheY-like receiver domain and an HTH DNA-binding domain